MRTGTNRGARRRLVALGMAAGLALAACGGGDDDTSAEPDESAADTGEAEDTAEGSDDGDADATTSEPATEDEAPSGDAVPLRWRTQAANQSEADVYTDISNEIDADLPHLDISYEAGANDGTSYTDLLKTELASGTAPDVFWIPGASIADFATRDLLLDMRDIADATDHSDSDFYEGPMYHLTYDHEAGEPGGTLWGLPRDVSTFALYLNLDLIAEAGAEDPRDLAANGEWNWTTLQEVSEDITALGGEVRGFGADAWWGTWSYWVNAAGGGMYNEDRTACGLDSAESLEGLTFARDFFASGNTVSWGENSSEPFLAGSVGMNVTGRWTVPAVRSLAEFNWDVVKLPDGPGGPSNWLFWGAYVVNAETEHPEEAWELVQALTSPDVQQGLSELGTNIPSRSDQENIDAFLTYSPPENNQAFIQGLTENPETEGPLWNGSWPAFYDTVNSRVVDVISGDESIESFADTICTEANNAAFGG